MRSHVDLMNWHSFLYDKVLFIAIGTLPTYDINVSDSYTDGNIYMHISYLSVSAWSVKNDVAMQLLRYAVVLFAIVIYPPRLLCMPVIMIMIIYCANLYIISYIQSSYNIHVQIYIKIKCSAL